MSEDQRRKYDESIAQMGLRFGENNSPLGYSTWKGPLRPHALFVDENACIGWGECVHFASNTFTMDEALGSARVKVQYGDDDQNIEVSVESCPVNCIPLVDTEELKVLEFLIQPQAKKVYGVFGGGWKGLQMSSVQLRLSINNYRERKHLDTAKAQVKQLLKKSQHKLELEPKQVP